MAHIEKRGVGRYRYRDSDGKERSKTFELRRDAGDFSRWLKRSFAARCGVDPRAGRRKFSGFAAAVIEPRSNIRPATSARIAIYLRVQIMPAFGEIAVSKITRLSVQSWVATMAQTLGSRTVRDAYRVFAGFMREAV